MDKTKVILKIYMENLIITLFFSKLTHQNNMCSVGKYNI